LAARTGRRLKKTGMATRLETSADALLHLFKLPPRDAHARHFASAGGVQKEKRGSSRLAGLISGPAARAGMGRLGGPPMKTRQVVPCDWPFDACDWELSECDEFDAAFFAAPPPCCGCGRWLRCLRLSLRRRIRRHRRPSTHRNCFLSGYAAVAVVIAAMGLSPERPPTRQDNFWNCRVAIAARTAAAYAELDYHRLPVELFSNIG